MGKSAENGRKEGKAGNREGRKGKGEYPQNKISGYGLGSSVHCWSVVVDNVAELSWVKSPCCGICYLIILDRSSRSAGAWSPAPVRDGPLSLSSDIKCLQCYVRSVSL